MGPLQPNSFGMMETEQGKALWNKLIPNERTVLSCIVLGQKRDLTCTGLDMNPKAYDRYRNNLTKKLDCQTDVDLTWTAVKHGWVKFKFATRSPVWVGGNREELTRCPDQSEVLLLKSGGALVLENWHL